MNENVVICLRASHHLMANERIYFVARDQVITIREEKCLLSTVSLFWKISRAMLVVARTIFNCLNGLPLARPSD